MGGIRLQLGHLRREPRLLLLLLRPHLGELRLQLRDLRGGGGCELLLLLLLLLGETLQSRERRRLLRQLGLDLVQLVVRRGVAQLLLVEVGLRPGQFRLKLCDHCAGCLAAGRDGGFGCLLLCELFGGQFDARPPGLEVLFGLRQLLPKACSILEGFLDSRLGRRLGSAPSLLRLAQLVGAVVQGPLQLLKFGAAPLGATIKHSPQLMDLLCVFVCPRLLRRGHVLVLFNDLRVALLGDQEHVPNPEAAARAMLDFGGRGAQHVPRGDTRSSRRSGPTSAPDFVLSLNNQGSNVVSEYER